MIAKLPSLIRINGDDISKSQRLAAKAKLAKLEDDLEVLAKDSNEKKELEKKEGKFNPDKWCPENRWRDYVAECERKEAEEKKRKEETIFKDYNDLMEEEKKAVSLVVSNLFLARTPYVPPPGRKTKTVQLGGLRMENVRKR